MELNISNALKTVLTQLSELYAVYWLLQKSGDFLVVSWIWVACVLLGSNAVPHVFFKATYFRCDSIVHVRLETVVGTVHWSCLVWVKMDSVSIMLDTVLSLSWGVDVKSLLILYVHMLELYVINLWLNSRWSYSRSWHLHYCWTCSVWENWDTVSKIGNWLYFHMVITQENVTAY